MGVFVHPAHQWLPLTPRDSRQAPSTPEAQSRTPSLRLCEFSTAAVTASEKFMVLESTWFMVPVLIQFTGYYLLIKARALISGKRASAVSDWKRISLCVGVFTPSFFPFALGKFLLFILVLCQRCFSRNSLFSDKGAAACSCVTQMFGTSPRGRGATL